MTIVRKLSDAKIKEKVFVEKIVGEKELRCRIMELGITKGVEILVKKIAPMGGTIEIFVRGYNLCLGKNETQNILIC